LSWLNRSVTKFTMCGIFGFIAAPGAPVGPATARRFLEDLFRLSEPRGREASGLAMASAGEIQIFKRGLAPSRMLKTDEYRRFLSGALDTMQVDKEGRLTSPFAVIGHCRMVTNGAEIVPGNNHPIITSHSIGIHNGIVTNDAALWSAHPDLEQAHETDSEVLFQLIDRHTADSGDLKSGIGQAFGEIDGAASVAFLRNDAPVLGLATNIGSLYMASFKDGQFFAFASEAFILNGFLECSAPELPPGGTGAVQIAKGSGCLVNFDAPLPEVFDLNGPATANVTAKTSAGPVMTVRDRSNRVSDIKRCSRCVLPETYPFIEFDADGVCQYCRDYKPMPLAGHDALEAELAKHRRTDGSPDCIVAFSGGRDSSYGLHLLKNEYRMNPIAYSYDWGMVTGIARRNQSRMLGNLGIEHILRADDIPAKRRYIRKNVLAWTKRPHLGMVPLFMAGDKFFYDIGRQLRDELDIPLVIFCAGNELERTDFKGGFAGVRESMHGQRLFAYSIANKVQIALFYFMQYLRNPAYFNESFIDTLQSFRSTFISEDDFLYLFHYLPWDEKIIDETLIGEYGWETAAHTDNTWRIGDGYTSFINYIYYTMAGFSEFDTFRSQEIRKGLMTREEALAQVAVDNKPDMGVLLEFAQLIGINLEEVMTRINTAKKLY